MPSPRQSGDERTEGQDPRTPLRIAHVTATFPPYWGGTGNVAWHQTHELARHGHEVHVFTADMGGERLAPTGVSVHRLRPLFRIGNAPLLPGLISALRGFDLIHLHYPFFFGAEEVWLASRLFRVPYLVQYHHDVAFAGLLRAVPRIHHAVSGEWILRAGTPLLFTTLDYGGTSFAAHLIGRRATAELPGGVDVERFHPDVDGAAYRQKLGVGPDEILVLFVGGLDRAHYFKGLPILFESLPHLHDLPIRLVVVGEGELRPEYERQAYRLGSSAAVRFVGRVSDEDLPGYYAAADLLAFPSLTRSEAFGLVLLEAMSSGTPVVASSLPGVRALVQGTGGGLLVQPGDSVALADAIRQLAQDPAARARLGMAGRDAVVRQYSWPALVTRLEGMYRETLARRAQRTSARFPL